MKTLTTLATITFGATSLLAATGTDALNPTSDGWAQHGAAVSHSQGDSDPLIVANSANNNRSYLRFAIPDYTAAGKTVTGVRLKVNMTQPPTKQNGKVGGQDCPGSLACISSRSYTLFKTNGSIPNDDAWTGNLYNLLPPNVNLASVSTGAVPALVTWTSGNLKSATVGAQGGNLGLILDDPQTGQNYESRFSSRENAQSPPVLEIDWTSDDLPTAGCAGVDPGTLLITRWGQTPGDLIPWNTATTQDILVNFTVRACGADFSNIKVQGGMAANTATQGWDSCSGETQCTIFSGVNVGTVSDSAIGGGKNKVQNQNNKVLTWTIPSLADGAAATLSIRTRADLNNQSKAACGVKNLTGEWSASGIWINAGTPESATASVGQLVVEFECPVY